ncbi:MAG: hypothetical protein K8R41_10320 [Bacteroidales bacterium]|nr:hypothetical protein [Bacteroidales bacterium]
MKKIKIILLALCFGIISNQASSQASMQDSSLFTTMFTGFYGYQFPGGDLVNRFGSNSEIGVSFLIKNNNNWIHGVEFDYLFGSDVKIGNTLFTDISTPEGNIIDGNGIFANIQLFERAYYSSLKAGKIFPVWGPNPNSGLVIIGGLGYINHKIRIDVENNTAPQLAGDYKKGYDRFTSGIAISEFFGYMYMGNKRKVNFYAGFEFIQAATKCRRDYNFDEMKGDDKNRLDLLFGIKAGWIIPLFKRTPEKFYYY